MRYDDPRLKAFIDESPGSLYSKLDIAHKTSFEKMVLVLLDELLPFMPMFVRYFTDHGAYHSKEVARMMDKLIMNITPPINPTEAFILLASAWLHDIGMLSNIDPQTGIALSDDEIRARHGELSAEFIERNKGRLFDFSDSLTVIKNNIKMVCKHHTTNVEEWVSPENDYEEFAIRTRLLISILRLADLLDLRENRAPKIVSDNIMLPDISQIHWEVYKTIKQPKEKEFISNYVDPQMGKNTIRVEISGITHHEEQDFRKLLFCYKIKKINEEIGKVRDFFEDAEVYLPREVIHNFRVDDKKILIKDFHKSSDDYFNQSKLELFEAEYREIQRKYTNPFVLIDLCLEVADQCEKIKNFEDKELGWRERAKRHYAEIRNKMPLTGYFHAAKKYNDIKLKREPSNSDEKKFINDMKIINRSIQYFIDKEDRYTESIYSPLILLRFGYTPLRIELKKTLLFTIKNRIVEKTDKKENKPLLHVHNECNLCTGRTLSLLSYLTQFKDFFCNFGFDSDFDKIILQIEGMVNWIKTQKKYNYSTISGQFKGIKSPRYTARILEGLLDLYFFNPEYRNGPIETLINDVARRWWEDKKILKVNKNELEEPITLVYGKFLRSIYLYGLQFDDNKIKQYLKKQDVFWREFMVKLNKEPLLSKFEGWSLSTCWDLWEDPGTKGIAKKTSENIRKSVAESAIWRKNGTWGDNDVNTKRAIESWLFYWEHFWRQEENKNISMENHK